MPDGYSIEVEGPVYQQDDDGRMRLVDGADIDPQRPFYLIPDEAAHEQGDEPTELAPEWQEVGMTEERIVLDVDQVRRTVDAIEATGTFADGLAERIAARTADGVSIAEVDAKRPVPAPRPFVLPAGLLGLAESEDEVASERPRYVPNRADLRALTRRRGRRG